jgi:hypothetical protein
MAAADETLAERGKLGVERVATVVKEIQLQEEGEIAPAAAVMGGESRRDPCAFEEDPDEAAVELELQEALAA